MRDYGELVKELRESAEWVDRLAVLMGRDVGDARAPLMRKAADAIEELLAAVPKWISVEANQKLPVSGLACTVGYFNGGKYGQLYWYDFVSKDENGVVVPHSTDIEGDCIAVYALSEPPKEVLPNGEV